MKRPFMVWIGLISICCSRKAKVARGCWYYKELLKTLKVAEHNLFIPNSQATQAILMHDRCDRLRSLRLSLRFYALQLAATIFVLV